VYSDSIIEAPVIFFLGAGASGPLGMPLMREFIDKLEATAGFKEQPLFTKIVSRERDLEFLFEELEEWAGKDYYAPRPIGGVISPPGGPLESGLIGASDSRFQDGLRSLIREAERLQAQLKREVFNTYRNISKPDEALRLFTPLFEAIPRGREATRYPLVVFTTNYDPSIETFCTLSSETYRLHDGFFHDQGRMAYVWQRSAFDEFSPSANKTDVILFKLHGSTNWTKAQGIVTRSPVSIFVEGDAAHENMLIYPAKRKVALEDPFFAGYDYFQSCAERSQICVVIGYSFRDYDALTKLMSASISNPKLTVLVVDPNAAKLCRELRARQIRAEPVAAAFGAGAGFEGYVGKVIAAVENALS